MEQPLAVAIISGLVVQLPLALVVLPVILKLFGLDRKAKPDAPAAESEGSSASHP